MKAKTIYSAFIICIPIILIDALVRALIPAMHLSAIIYEYPILSFFYTSLAIMKGVSFLMIYYILFSYFRNRELNVAKFIYGGIVILSFINMMISYLRISEDHSPNSFPAILRGIEGLLLIAGPICILTIKKLKGSEIKELKRYALYLLIAKAVVIVYFIILVSLVKDVPKFFIESIIVPLPLLFLIRFATALIKEEHHSQIISRLDNL